MTRKPRGRSALAVSCRRRGGAIQLSLRPRVRGRSLRQVVGPSLGIGFINPTQHTVGVRTTFAAH